MTYVFDSGPFITMFRHYYRDRFPSLWDLFDDMIRNQKIVSVKEVSNELEDYGDTLSIWVKDNPQVFHLPSNEETVFVSRIFAIKHFRALISKQAQLEGKPVPDPFVIAKAYILGDEGCVVTTEKLKPHAAKIPNVCEHFGIRCIDIEGFMTEEDWSF